MIDWIRDHAAATWIGIAVLLAIVEMMSLDLVLLMFALGALAAAVTAGLGAPVWVAIIVFAAVALGLLFFVRPPMVARLHAGPTLTQGHDSLIGKTAVVAEPVDKHGGRVKLSGEVWSARSESESDSFETGTEVQVTRIDGATAVVTTKES